MASNVIVRAAVVRVDSKKIAEAFKHDLGVTSGDTAVFGAEGYLGHSSGAGQSTLDFDSIVPVPGMSKDVVTYLIQKKRASLTFFAGGKEYQIENAALTKFNLTSETQSGVLQGTFNWEGGPPTVIG